MSHLAATASSARPTALALEVEAHGQPVDERPPADPHPVPAPQFVAGLPVAGTRNGGTRV